jgi:hypothetical protein
MTEEILISDFRRITLTYKHPITLLALSFSLFKSGTLRGHLFPAFRKIIPSPCTKLVKAHVQHYKKEYENSTSTTLAKTLLRRKTKFQLAKPLNSAPRLNATSGYKSRSRIVQGQGEQYAITRKVWLRIRSSDVEAPGHVTACGFWRSESTSTEIQMWKGEAELYYVFYSCLRHLPSDSKIYECRTLRFWNEYDWLKKRGLQS